MARAPERSRAIGAACGARQEEQGAVAFQPGVTRKQGSNPVCFLKLILYMAITSPDCSGYEEGCRMVPPPGAPHHIQHPKAALP